jgi:hypothetical protein
MTQETWKPLVKFLNWVKSVDLAQDWAKTVRKVPTWRIDGSSHYLDLAQKKHTEAAESLIEQKQDRRENFIKQTEVEYRGVHPQIVEFWKAFRDECGKRNISVRAFEFVRSAKRQNELKAQGRSNAPAGKSPHQYGCAVDIISSKHGWNLTKKEWDILIAIGDEVARKRKIKMKNGAAFDGLYDPAHWELKNWQQYKLAQDYCVKTEIMLPEDTKQKFLKLEYIYETIKRDD